MSEDFNERYRQALRLIRECDYGDLKSIQEVVNQNIQAIEDERNRVKKVEVVQVGYYAFGTLMPEKVFRVSHLDEAREYAKKLIDDDKAKGVIVGYQTVLVYPDELEAWGLSSGGN